jgi:hypothetical protein
MGPEHQRLREPAKFRVPLPGDSGSPPLGDFRVRWNDCFVGPLPAGLDSPAIACRGCGGWPAGAKRIGFLVAATFGLLLFCCKAEEYYYNVCFRTKVLLLALIAVHGLIFRGRVYNRLGEAMPVGLPDLTVRVAAALSLLLWAGVLTAGRAIGYVPARAGLHFL